MSEQAFYTLPQLAKRWQVSRKSVERYIARGELRAVRMGRAVRVAAVEVQRFESLRPAA